MYSVIWEGAFLATGEESVTSLYQCLSPSKYGMFQCLASVEDWVNFETVLGDCHVCADVLAQIIQQTQCWISVGPVS